MTEIPAERMRLDKWLWAARFFRTRALAAEAVGGGKVHVDGQRAKPGREIHVGSRIQVSKDGLEWDVEVRMLCPQRRPAPEARAFYEEAAEGRAKREAMVAERRAERESAPYPPAVRPGKRDRRLIQRFKQQAE
jgi:ribosome-associated heat shock protein Hsp15